jgi:hypothetical protein
MVKEEQGPEHAAAGFKPVILGKDLHAIDHELRAVARRSSPIGTGRKSTSGGRGSSSSPPHG